MDFNEISYTALLWRYLLLTASVQGEGHRCWWAAPAYPESRLHGSWDELDQRIFGKAIKQWRTRLRAYVEAKSGHFEHKLWKLVQNDRLHECFTFGKICQVLTLLHQLICRGVANFGTRCSSNILYLNPSQGGWYSYVPTLKDGRLSWPVRWLYTKMNGLPFWVTDPTSNLAPHRATMLITKPYVVVLILSSR